MYVDRAMGNLAPGSVFRSLRGIVAAVNLHSYFHIVDILYVAFGIYE